MPTMSASNLNAAAFGIGLIALLVVGAGAVSGPAAYAIGAIAIVAALVGLGVAVLRPDSRG